MPQGFKANMLVSTSIGVSHCVVYIAHVLLCFSCFCLFATPSQAHVNDAGYGYQLQRLSTDGGLSQGSVSAIAQDDFGYMWFATGRGLNRYDGYKVTLLRANTLH